MLRSLFLLGAPVFFAFGLWNVLLLPMAIKVLGATEFEYGIQEGLTSVGFVVGSACSWPATPTGCRPGIWVFVGYSRHGHRRASSTACRPTILIAIAWS